MAEPPEQLPIAKPSSGWLTPVQIAEVEMIFAVLCYGLSYIPMKACITRDEIGPYTLNGLKYFIETMFIMVPFHLFIKYSYEGTILYRCTFVTQVEHGSDEESTHLLPEKDTIPKIWNTLFFYGSLNGLSAAMAYTFVVLGLQTTTASQSVFISCMYVVLVPIGEHFCGRTYFFSN